MVWFRKIAPFPVLILGLGLFFFAITGCGSEADNPVDGDDNHNAGPDTTAPAAVTDLRLRSPTQSTLALVWTAPGDDGEVGTAARYDIRYSMQPITDENWDDAAMLDSDQLPTPKPGGEIETIVVQGLASGTTFYFALKTSDEVPNQSGLSNCCAEATLKETIPPSDIKNLRATAIDELSFELVWTAPGDDYGTGTAARYDIRYSMQPIEDQSDFDRAIPAPDPPTPKPAGEMERFVVTGLTGRNYFFAIKTADELDNWSGLSNMGIGLGYSEIFLIFPGGITVGEESYVIFRAADGEETRISLHPLNVPHYCGEQAIVDLVKEVLPVGVHSVQFRFIDPDTGNYLQPGMYGMSLCYGNEVQKWYYVSLYE
ncbi:MAG: hypothetical protein P8181_06195 [bacterium]